eukprot:jgi/Picre1/29239/NNA_004631.t1
MATRMGHAWTGKVLPRPALVAYEKGDTVVDVESLLRSCSMKGLSPKVAERIRQADVDHDGALSVDELIEVIRTEMQAVSIASCSATS